MNIFCKIFGHNDVFQRNVEGGGLFVQNELVMPLKEYKCLTCGRLLYGTVMTKEDRKLAKKYLVTS